MDAPRAIARLSQTYDRGLIPRYEYDSELISLIASAHSDRDAEFGEVVDAVATLPVLPSAALGFTARLIGADAASPALRARIAVILASDADAQDKAELLAALPVSMTTSAAVHSVLDAVTDRRERIACIRLLARALHHHEHDGGLFAMAVHPHLPLSSGEEAALVAHAYLEIAPASEEARITRRALSTRPDLLDPDALLTLAARFSIEGRDDLAVDFADAAMAHRLEPRRLPVAGAVFWIAGLIDRAQQATFGYEPDAQGWWSQAASSLDAFLRTAGSPPTEVLRLLTRPPSEGLIRRPASVGALVGRAAYLRMCAFRELGALADAVSEAHAVDTAHAYRDYSLHVQAADLEFDRRLLDRLAVTAEELAAVRDLIARHPLIPAPTWSILEGELVRRD